MVVVFISGTGTGAGCVKNVSIVKNVKGHKMLFRKKTRMIFVVVGWVAEPKKYTYQKYQPLILGICKNFKNAQRLFTKCESTRLYSRVEIQYVPSDL